MFAHNRDEDNSEKSEICEHGIQLMRSMGFPASQADP